MLNVQSLDCVILLLPIPIHAPLLGTKSPIETTIEVLFFEGFDERRPELWEQVSVNSPAHVLVAVSCFLFSADSQHLCMHKCLFAIPLLESSVYR